MLVTSGGPVAWWTFAGGRANAALAQRLTRRMGSPVAADNFVVRFEPGAMPEGVGPMIDRLGDPDPRPILPAVSEEALEGLKFAKFLPRDLAIRVVRGRLSDEDGLKEILRRTTRRALLVRVRIRRARRRVGRCTNGANYQPSWITPWICRPS